MSSLYDFHSHTRRSPDSLTSARQIIAAARKRGLSGVAVTDHDTIAGGLDVAKVAPPDLLVIVGAEYYTDVGDIVGLFLSREVVSRNAIEVIAEIHDQGGIAFLPHPLRSHPPIPKEVLVLLDGYEALNSRAGWFDPAKPQSKPGSWSTLIGKAALGSSDSHLASELGIAFTRIAGPATAENVRASILAGRTQPGGTTGPPRNFYISQLIKAIKSGDFSPVVRRLRRLPRKLFDRTQRPARS